jgi:hypothetical protein
VQLELRGMSRVGKRCRTGRQVLPQVLPIWHLRNCRRREVSRKRVTSADIWKSRPPQRAEKVPGRKKVSGPFSVKRIPPPFIRRSCSGHRGRSGANEGLSNVRRRAGGLKESFPFRAPGIHSPICRQNAIVDFKCRCKGRNLWCPDGRPVAGDIINGLPAPAGHAGESGRHDEPTVSCCTPTGGSLFSLHGGSEARTGPGPLSINEIGPLRMVV